MNFKRLSTSFIALLLVVCLLVNCSPVKAEATSAAIVGTAVVAAPIVIGSLLQAVGIAPAPDSSAFENLVNKCVNFISETTSYITDGNLIMARMADEFMTRYYIVQDLIDIVRGWLYDTAVIGTPVPSVYVCSSLEYEMLGMTFPNMVDCNFPFFEALEYCAVTESVLVYGGNASYLWGFYFDEYGKLHNGVFENPYGNISASYCGAIAFNSLVLTDSYSPIYNFYASEEKAILDPDFTSARGYLIDWASAGAFLDVGWQMYFDVPCKSKGEASIDFSETVASVECKMFTDAVSGNFSRLTKKYIISGIDVESYYFPLPDGLVANDIVLPGEALSDAYPTWYQNTVALPGSITLPGGGSGTDDETEEKTHFPLGIPIWPDWNFDSIPQEEAQSGDAISVKDETDSETGTGTGTATDAVTATGLKGWLDSIQLTLRTWGDIIRDTLVDIWNTIKTGFSNLVSAVANLPAALLAILRSLADHFKWIAAILDLIRKFGDYIAALFSWLPEPMWFLVQTIFVFVGIYKLIGREG